MSGTPNKGMGFAPLGVSLFGYGTPATLGVDQGITLQKKVNGPSADARYIDPFTRDYVLDEDGVVKGQSAVAQQVYLACITTKGSSIIQNLGSDFSRVRTINSQTVRSQMTKIFQQALASLINNGSVTLLSVDTFVNTNGIGINITINWVDNLTGETNTTKI